MIPRSLDILLTTFILFTIYAHALPTLSLNTTDPNSELTAVKTGVNCWPLDIRGSRYASTRDCLQVALLLPDGADPGVFHTGNPSDSLQLPVAKTYESCQILVSMTGTNFDRSSWDHISYAASQMGAICSTGQYPLGQSGGVMYVGIRNQIRVAIGRAEVSDTGGSDVSNLTATSLIGTS